MDRGLTRAVERFAGEVGAALRTAAAGTSVGPDEMADTAMLEAFNVCVAFIDADERHTDDELWALVAAFSQHAFLDGRSTPASLRRDDIVRGKKAWLSKPSDVFETLRHCDVARGTNLARTYYDEAMALAHVVASLDTYPSEPELRSIVAYQRLLLAALPSPGRTVTGQGEAGGNGGGADERSETVAETEQEPLGPPEPLDDVLAELDELIGLAAVKEEVRLLSALLRVQKLREERGLPVVDSNKHLIFSGNPGTGKTTVARLLARIYRSLGVVERGHLTEVDRGGLVAGFVGQTAAKVADVFDRADGGVLLIDEAYSLTRGGAKDFGREAIDAVVKQVEDRRDSMVVILAGYPKEMADLVATNPGFQSRFPKTINFPDYDNDELVAILGLIADGGAYTLTDEATEAAEAWFGAHPRGRGFGNGRLARNLFEAAVARHATRLVEIAEPTDEELTTLEAVDVASVPVGDEAVDGAPPRRRAADRLVIARLRGAATGANLVAAGIALSRMAGLIREQVLAVALGNGAVTDAFRLAMRVPNVLQNLLGEGALSASFIPVYARLVEEGEEGEADRLAGAVGSLLAAATAVIVAVGVLLAGPIVRLFSQFESDPELFDLAVTLLRITTIGIGFLVLSAWCLGILNSHRSFFLPYVAPVLWNGLQIVVLVAVVLLGVDVDDAAVAAAWAVVAGGAAQFGVQLPKVRRLAPHLRPSLARTSQVDDVLTRFAPAVGARGVVQISSFIDTFLALALVAGGLSLYAFALPLYLLPISLFGFSVAASELAEMSRRSGNEARVAGRVRPALQRVLLPGGFVLAAYVAAGRPIVDALYGWPSRLFDQGFDAADVTAVAVVISVFAVGLPASMSARITQNTLYSLGEVRGPARIAVIRLVVSVTIAVIAMLQLDWLFVGGTDGRNIEQFADVPHWPPFERVPEARRLDGDLGIPHLGAAGLAVGSAVASWTEWWLLRRMLGRRLGLRISSGWGRPIAIAAVASAATMLLVRLVPVPSPLDAAFVVGIGAAIYGGALWMQGVRRLPQLASRA